VPGLRQDGHPRNTLMIDGSGGTAPFVGLTLVFLNFIADGPARHTPPPVPLLADRNGVTVHGRGEAKFATARHDDVWLAVRPHQSFHRFTDLRYDGGLVQLKRRQSNGAWLDLLAARPHVPEGPPDSAGPLLVTRHGRRALGGDRLRPLAKGGVRVSGAYRRIGAAHGGVRGGVETIRPTRCGAEVSFGGRRGERVEYSVFLPDRPPREQPGRQYSDPLRGPVTAPGSVSAADTFVSFDPSAKVTLRHGYQSATDPHVVRARLRWKLDRDRTLRVTICQLYAPS
jgi:hypothetical protein